MSFDWDAIRNASQGLDMELLRRAMSHGRAEAMYEALMRSRDLAEWAAYLEAHPPTPEVLAIALSRPNAKAWSEMAADEKHAENRAMKAQVLEWYTANKASFRTKDEAAAAAATKIVPAKVRTIRDWLKRQ
jgi:hypothetical protein